MLRLWPSTVSIGIYPGIAWLRQGFGQGKLHHATTEVTMSPAEAFTRLLDEAAPKLQPRTRLTITIADCWGSALALPWAANLKTAAEEAAYARACFGRAGMEVARERPLRVEFRHWQAMGLAYSLPVELLREFKRITDDCGFELRSVVPACALTHKFFVRRAGGPRVLLSFMTTHATVICCDSWGLSGWDIEPVVGSAEGSIRRLMARVRNRHGDGISVSFWSPTSTEDTIHYTADPATIDRTYSAGYWLMKQ